MVWVFLAEMMNSCSVNFLHMLSYNFMLYLVLGLVAYNVHTLNLKLVGSRKHDPNLSCCKLWYGQIELLWSSPKWYLTSGVFNFWKHKNIIKFLDDMKFLSKAICCFHCKTFHIRCEIHFILPWSRSRTRFHHILCFYTRSKQTSIHKIKLHVHVWHHSLSKIYQGYGAMQKENKRCIPKEGMPHA